jgi:hypothetical protein
LGCGRAPQAGRDRDGRLRGSTSYVMLTLARVRRVGRVLHFDLRAAAQVLALADAFALACDKKVGIHSDPPGCIGVHRDHRDHRDA